MSVDGFVYVTHPPGLFVHNNITALEQYADLDVNGTYSLQTRVAFIAEIGDKTQVATVVLAARYPETLWVIIGTTVGMLLANIPVIMAGKWLMDRLPLATARLGASILFVLLAIATVWAALV